MLYVRITFRFLLAILFCLFVRIFHSLPITPPIKSFGLVGEKKNHPIFHGRWETLKYATINRLLTIKQYIFVCYHSILSFPTLRSIWPVYCFLFFGEEPSSDPFLRYLILAKTKITHPPTHTKLNKYSLSCWIPFGRVFTSIKCLSKGFIIF